MGRRVVIGVVIVLFVVAAGAGFALLADDDDSSDTAGGTTTTTGAVATTFATSTTAPTTTAAPTTTTPTTTTLPPSAAIGACGAEGASIAAAVTNGVSGACDRANVDECRLAPVDPSWAAVQLVAKPGAAFDATTVVLHGGGGAWAIVASGDGAGCGQAPQQVLVDLGIQCSSGGGRP